MGIAWLNDRCIVCTQAGQKLTEAHVIPAAIGGSLAINFECDACNGDLGRRVEAKLKSDIRVRLAIESLKDLIPHLAARMRGGQPFVAVTDVRIRATPDGAGYRILDSPQADGSRIKTDERAADEVRTTLQRRGESSEVIDAALEAKSSAPHGDPVPVAPGIAIRRGSIADSDIGVDFGEAPLIDDLCMLAIAYRFVAVAAGTTIFASDFDPMRDELRSLAKHPASWHVEYVAADRPHEPFHGLAVQQLEPHLVIQIRLFGKNAWLVHLDGIASSTPFPISSYTMDLATGQNYVAGSRSAA